MGSGSLLIKKQNKTKTKIQKQSKKEQQTNKKQCCKGHFRLDKDNFWEFLHSLKLFLAVGL